MASAEPFPRPENASDDGGYVFSAASVKEQRKIMTSWLKQVGFNLLDIKNIMRTSLPVKLFEGRSYLQRIADGFSFMPFFLTRAAQATDPVERLKNVIASVIAGLHLTCTQAKPFNPILGETYQGVFEDGTLIYCEQVSHHPMVSAWEMIGPNGCFHFSGHGQWIGSFRGNSVKGAQQGESIVRFADGDWIQWGPLPELWMRGVVLGERRIEYLGIVPFYYAKYNLGCTLTFNPDSGILNFFKGRNKPSDWIRGDIVRLKPEAAAEAERQCRLRVAHASYTDDDAESGQAKKQDEDLKPPKVFEGVKYKGETVSKCEGTWLGGLDFDGVRYWDRVKMNPSTVQTIPNPLQSDSGYREDLQCVLKSEWDEAATWKHTLEEKQRYDARLREAARKQRKK